ncbi:hypothetical protein DFH08DRAFT_811553 [Mycena albidolilacea]|uniref:Uncharacterized protein n=1 Tax=Mycena albidolilacea TaxID=1033008 RepID=A0AAD7EN11_9AGAR|nr:hypothetical protein DFH08DRAFT_811553 [Mycena albidolilacea]
MGAPASRQTDERTGGVTAPTTCRRPSSDEDPQSTSPANTRIVVTYTPQPGDSQAFFFQVVDNKRRLDLKDFGDRQAFSGSESFLAIPGDLRDVCGRVPLSGAVVLGL